MTILELLNNSRHPFLYNTKVLQILIFSVWKVHLWLSGCVVLDAVFGQNCFEFLMHLQNMSHCQLPESLVCQSLLFQTWVCPTVMRDSSKWSVWFSLCLWQRESTKCIIGIGGTILLSYLFGIICSVFQPLSCFNGWFRSESQLLFTSQPTTSAESCCYWSKRWQ